MTKSSSCGLTKVRKLTLYTPRLPVVILAIFGAAQEGAPRSWISEEAQITVFTATSQTNTLQELSQNRSFVVKYIYIQQNRARLPLL